MNKRRYPRENVSGTRKRIIYYKLKFYLFILDRILEPAVKKLNAAVKNTDEFFYNEFKEQRN